MIEFAFPWAFLFLPLPLAAWWLLPSYRETRDAIRVPFFQTLVELSGSRPGTSGVLLSRTALQRLLIVTSWILLVVGLARPELVGAPIERIESSRDLMIAVDISGSMEHQDFTSDGPFPVSRIAAVKTVLKEFARARETDRLGLIVFGQAPYLQAPFTPDHEAWLQLLEESQIGMAGLNTALGDAIGLAVKIFRNGDAQNRVLILLTDGNDTNSRVRPIDAAKIARQENIRIYTIAVGDPASIGEEAIDTDVLKRVAQLTGGDFFQALEHEQLTDIHRQILELEAEVYETKTFQPRRSLFHFPLGLSVLLTLIMHGFFVLNAKHERPGRSRAHDD